MSYLNRFAFAMVLIMVCVFVPAQADANTDARIINFTVSPNPMPIGTTELTISWATENAQTIQLRYGSDDRPHRASYEELPPSGTRTLTMNESSVSEPYVDYWGSRLDFISLFAGGDNLGVGNEDERTHRILCTSDSWFFANPPEECPYISRNERLMAIQHFENGVMIWTDYSIVILTEQNGEPWNMCCFSAEWTPDMPEDSNPALTPPSGKFKPLKQFGVAWAFEPVRNALGWAIDEAEVYSGFSQCLRTELNGWGECYYGTSSNQIYAVGLPYPADAWSVIYREITAERDGTPPSPDNEDTPPNDNDNEMCIIPPSGPWPPCATGGGTATPSPAPPSNDDETCVIPPSGPWPPCATGGSTPPNPNSDDNESCIIPPSGPWPPCATGGGTTPSPAPPNSDDEACVIPPSGPWPQCAR